jgi:integral membrane protein
MLTPRFRLLAYLEGGAFLLLLGVAMPLKYWAGLPLAVRVVGLAHGLLFIFYVVAVVQAVNDHRWSRREGTAAFVAALLPFGPFVFEAWLKHASKDRRGAL